MEAVKVHRIALVIGIAVATLGTLFLVPRQAEAAGQQFKFFQFNMCGSDSADCGNGGVSGEVVDAIVASIEDFSPDVVTLNEVCESQLESIYSRIRSLGYSRDHTATLNSPGACPEGSHDFGNAMLWLGQAGGTVRTQLYTSAGEEPRYLTCLNTYPRGVGIRLCVTHLSSGQSPTGHFERERARQVQQIANIVNPYIDAGVSVIIGGDFNTEPDSYALDPLYNAAFGSGGDGQFGETDACVLRTLSNSTCNEPTLGSSKKDYIFLSSANFSYFSGDATHSEVSDHDPMRGTARINGT